MNKIYKLVWSQVKNTWVAASEMAKSHGKSNRARGRVTLVAAVLGVLMATALPTFGVYAADLTADQQAVYDAVLKKLDENKTAVHYFSVNSDNLKGTDDKSFDDFTNYSNKLATGTQSMAIGRLSRTPATGAMAVGHHAVAEGFFSVAIGPDALVTGEKITADEYDALSDEDKQLYAPVDTAATSYLKIKMKATKDGQDSFEEEVNQGVAVGRHARVQAKRGTAIGSYADVHALQGTALGFKADSTGENSTALGATAKARSKNSVAIGFGTEAAFNDSVALGSFSRAQTKAGISGWDTSLGISDGAISSDESHVWKSTLPAISVGNNQDKKTRQIINVAAGYEDTDAVNVAQLKRLREKHNADHDALSKRISANNGDISNLRNKVLNMGDDIRANKADVTNLKAGFTIKDGNSGSSDVALGGKDKAAITFKAVTQEGDGTGDALTAAVSDDQTVTYTLNTKKLKQDLGIGDKGVGTMNSWKLKAGDGNAVDIADGDTVAFDVKEPNKGITVEQDGNTVKYGIDGSKIDLAGNASITNLNKQINDSKIHYFSVKSDDSKNPADTNWNNDGATGKNAIAIGKDAKAERESSVVIGLKASSGVAANDGVAVGSSASVTGFGGVAIGRESSAEGQETVAIGTGAKGVIHRTVAIGGYANADGFGAVAIGRDSMSKERGVSVGIQSNSKEFAVSVGTNSFSNFRSVAVGELANAEAPYAVAVGDQTGSYAMGAVTLGNKTRAFGDSSVAIGNQARVSGKGITPEEYKALPEADQKLYRLYEAVYYNYDDPSKPLVDRKYYKVIDAHDWRAANQYNSIAIGTTSFVEAKEAIGIGAGTRINGDLGVALGYAAVSEEKGTALGAGAQAKANAGVALGEGAVADTAAEVAGYDPKTGKASTETTPTWKSVKGAVSVGNADATRQITNLAAGTNDTDAVNVAQLKAVQNIAAAKTTIEAGDNITVAPGSAAGSYKISATDTTLKADTNALSLKGNTLNLSVKDTAGKEVTGSVDLKDLKGAVDTNTTYTMTGKENDDNTTTISLTDNDGKEQKVTVATKDTNTYTTGGSYDANKKKLVFTQSDPSKNYEVDVSKMISDVVNTDTTYTLKGEENDNNTTTISLTDSNGKKQQVTVATKDTRNTIVDSDTVTVEAKAQEDGSNEYKLNVKADGKIEKGNTGIVTGGTVYNETRIEKDGNYIKAGNTAGQNLTALDEQVGANTANIAKLGNSVYGMSDRINKVGAGAAALAALHPLDFDPDDKWDFAAGYGNYSGANAVAIGAYYRPNEDTMFSVGGSFGGGENMVNAGVSVKLGQGNHVSTSRVAMAKDMLDMQQRMAEMEAQMAKLQGFIGALTGADAQAAMFPDVPENHWAYEYVDGLREQGIIEGYPDGNFAGDRSMTRYEIAAMLYRALSKGVSLDARAVKEFAPELARIRVDVVTKDKEGQPVIERVRVNEEQQAK
ncbi:MAG: ESPR-type extended signal peptide-containing protein [Negativicoccus succinicivorans]|uniref:ESPR-type extended signal peptide-containing protein n=1 Tax=Negativicoccus succinicivorans TaxID=620903 RepID=UPI00290357D2|nr:ESPR-type extended signal peptide-containing protein [Negativicoccus succinicivorans]MDU2643788.1 ESPR-type extended signal peptide-containing protein [Negativicoccus succinicivorans]